MNIFYLDKSPVLCAQWMVDKHVVKMIVETAQMLSTAHRVLDGTQIIQSYEKSNGKIGSRKHMLLVDEREPILYKATHANHPSSVWARTSVQNYNWLVEHMYALGSEYTYRYGKTHATITKLAYLLQSPPYGLQKQGWTEPPSCMPDEFKTSDVVANYREYYKTAKAHLHSWKKREKPDWI